MQALGLFAQQLLDNLKKRYSNEMHIADREGYIVASTSAAPMGQRHAAALAAISGQNSDGADGTTAASAGMVATPLRLHGRTAAVILVGPGTADQVMLAELIRAALAAGISYDKWRQTSEETASPEEIIVRELLSANPSRESREATALEQLKRLGLDLSLSRAVIAVALEKKVNRFFNINLDLGYDASAEQLKDKVITTIKSNRYLTKSDIVAPYGNDRIVVIKSFPAVADRSKLYCALDKIAAVIIDDLNANKIFSCHLGYGNIYDRVTDMQRSYQEAENAIMLNAIFSHAAETYKMDDLLLEQVCFYLPRGIIDKCLLPILAKLHTANGVPDYALLDIVQTFIDSGLNASLTAKVLFLHRNTVLGKLKKYQAITGLNPAASFRDAFLTKMAAIYARLHQHGHDTAPPT